MRNDTPDANSLFTNPAGPEQHFGGTAGGRIWPNQTVFFTGYERVGGRHVRAGDLSRYSNFVYDPPARHLGPAGTEISTPFPNRHIRPAQFNATSAAIAQR
ncbi:MAG: hypothetical protein EXQ52_07995 [Bryobacterales bacterium]|nr:hypothetical protein [Bryobacterales bacterium]